MAFKDNLYFQRTKAGLSQKELAEKLFVSQQMVGAMETGLKSPSVNMLMQLANVFDCTVNDLVYDTTCKKCPKGGAQNDQDHRKN